MRGVGRSAVVIAGLGLIGLVHPVGSAATAPADAPACTTDRVQYVSQPSPVLENLAIPQTWSLATGSGVTVAVVDSGVNTGNAHLPADSAVLPGVSFVPGDAGDGRTDRIGHGTAVASIIGGREVAGSAMIGAAPRAQILPVRVYTADGDDAEESDVPPTGERIAEGIRWAVENGADVVNVSLSVPSNNTDLDAMRSAIDLARERDVVVVAATGNALEDETGVGSFEERYPAAFDGVIGVAATNDQGVTDTRSIRGPQVDLAGPGASVLVAFQANGDCQTEPVAFTSWATPFVSALAAQLKERFPEMSAADIEYAMTSTARRPVTGSRDDNEGWGLIQPYEALSVVDDRRRPGPSEEFAALSRAEGQVEGATPLGVSTDPLAPARNEVLWWSIGGVGLAALALLARPLVRRHRDAGERREEPAH